MEKLHKVNILSLITLLYLYVPIIVFFLFWLKPLVGIPCALISCWISIRCSFSKKKSIKLRKIWLFLLLAVCIIVVWALLSGLGGFFQQSYDWQKHNVLLNDFINKSWPVTYDFNGKHGVVSYYVAEYILPGIVGKISNFNVAQDFLLLWMILGLVLLVLAIYTWIGKENGWILLLVVFGLIMFSTFIYPLSGIYGNWVPADYHYMGDMGEWFSNNLKIQYTSNVSLLRFVFPQFVPIAIATILWIKNRYTYQVWGAILAPTVLYSTFAFFGLGLLMFFVLIRDIADRQVTIDWHKVISIINVLAVLITIVLLLYIAANILQPKPADVKMKFSFIDFRAHKLGFITFQAAWFIWILLLLKYERKNPLLYIVSGVLFLLPFCEFGAANDLVMRVSIPALLVINFTVIKNIAMHFKGDRYFSCILIGALIISGAGPLLQLRNAARVHDFHHHVYNMPFKKGNEFFRSDKNVVYQYVDWSNNKLRKIIIRK